MKKEQKQQVSTEPSNVLYTLLCAGYSSCEVCFNIKLKRRGIMKWLENKNIIKPKKEGFALMIMDFDRVDILSSSEESVVSITSAKVNGLR